jgi:hypothetical protein
MADIIISGLIGLLAAGLAVVGVYVSFVPLSPEDKDRPFLRRRAAWVSVALTVLTIAIIVLTGIQAWRNGKQNEGNTEAIRNLGTDLKNSRDAQDKAQQSLQAALLSQEYMKGQLSGLSMMVGRLDSDGNAGSVNLAKALRQLASEPKPHATGIEPPAIKKMTNAQLRTKVIDFANDMRTYTSEFEAETQRQSMDLSKQWMAIPATEREKKNQAGDAMSQLYTRRSQAYDLYTQQALLGSATEFKDELIFGIYIHHSLAGERLKDAYSYSFSSIARIC